MYPPKYEQIVLERSNAASISVLSSSSITYGVDVFHKDDGDMLR